ncbi:MAG: glycosyltransferase [Actinobacteria bacterium]|nr:MAG: glycosyltransferase [Actinomycetota bacterium]
MAEPAITAIVPTRSRPDALERCLRALARQTIAETLEIVVVADGEQAAEAVEALVGSYPGARLLAQQQRGPAAARNLGAASARARLLCFTDDDCEPQPDWAERLADALERGADAAAGSTVNPEEDDPLAAASQLVVTHLTAESARSSVHAVYGTANNLACTAALASEVPFDPGFSFAGGDRDWCARVVAAGRRIVDVPDAIVFHRQRLTPASFWRQHVAYGQGAYRYRRLHGSRLRLEGPAFYGRLLRRGLADGPRVGALVALTQVATAVGYARATLSRLR